MIPVVHMLRQADQFVRAYQLGHWMRELAHWSVYGLVPAPYWYLEKRKRPVFLPAKATLYVPRVV